MNSIKYSRRIFKASFFVKRIILGISVLLLILLVSCLEIVNINQPDIANIGEEITITIDAKVTGDAGNTLIFGFLAPRAWKPAENTMVSFVSTIGNSTMSYAGNEADAENKLPWVEQIKDRVGFGSNYGEVEWIVFKADKSFDPPAGTDENSPVTGTITVITKVGTSNLIAQLGYFLGEATWGYLNDDGNSTFFFAEKCIEIIGASGQAQNLCGPAPRRLIGLETFTFDDLLTINFDAQEDMTALIGANEVFACFTAIHSDGTTEICDISSKTQMKMVAQDLWQLTIWPPSFFDLSKTSEISEILVNFQDATGMKVVKDPGGVDFQILTKCF